jgi:bifunctional pyridoxal-dependent enzyme with beta-cystathionase and maltose regulon repressor activities
MQFSQLTNRINGEGAAAWDLHEVAIKDAMAGKDVIVLSVGDPDFATPAAIKVPLMKSLLLILLILKFIHISLARFLSYDIIV